ncbi:MAG: YdiU family protein [Pseudomonadota bacterium]
MTGTTSAPSSPTQPAASPAAPTALDHRLEGRYAALPERFHARQSPRPVRAPQLVRINEGLAQELGLDPEALAEPASVAALAGNRVPAGAVPVAIAYAGHQFGHWVPRLGDGRAVLLGEIVDQEGRLRDIQLKGSGRTPFARGGDGRAPLGPVLREFIVSEAMAALGVPTTRSLAAVATGEAVPREAVEPGGVLTRVAASHIRIGTFQYLYSRQDAGGLRVLAAHAADRHDPTAAGLEGEEQAVALLRGVIARQAQLVARWMSLGFIHGVMNTDNMTISGETIDYGPCAFMEAFDPNMVYSSIDQTGRYAYGNQPRVAHWNLAQLAQALLPILPGAAEGDEDGALAAAQKAVDAFPAIFDGFWLAEMRRKLGLRAKEEADETLLRDLLERMAANRADFTLTFRELADLADPETMEGEGPRSLFADPTAFDTWAEGWQRRCARDPMSPVERRAAMRVCNPRYIPRNHLVEEAITAAYQDDLAPFERLIAVLARPFEDQPGAERYALPATPEQEVQYTFCGT